jgi:hypothetical protein
MSRQQRRDDLFQQDIRQGERIATVERAVQAPRHWTRIAADATQPVYFNAGWDHYDVTAGGWGFAEYRILDDEVQLRGSVKLSSGAVPASGATPITVAPEYRPQRYAGFPFLLPATVAGLLYIGSPGVLTLSGAASSNRVFLDPVRFSFMPATTG